MILKKGAKVDEAISDQCNIKINVVDTPLHLAMKNLKNTKGPMGQNTLRNIIRLLLKYNADYRL